MANPCTNCRYNRGSLQIESKPYVACSKRRGHVPAAIVTCRFRIERRAHLTVVRSNG